MRLTDGLSFASLSLSETIETVLGSRCVKEERGAAALVLKAAALSCKCFNGSSLCAFFLLAAEQISSSSEASRAARWNVNVRARWLPSSLFSTRTLSWFSAPLSWRRCQLQISDSRPGWPQHQQINSDYIYNYTLTVPPSTDKTGFDTFKQISSFLFLERRSLVQTHSFRL